MKTKTILLIITLLYLFTRLYNLTLLPIFFDEANYIFWAKQIAGTGEHWFISLSGGKPFPLIWLMAFFLKILPDAQYLLAARLPSVIFGLVTLFGVYRLTKLTLRSEKASLLAALFYVLVPFTLFHDRMALYDSQLAAMTTWTMFFFLKTLNSLEPKDALGWGVFLGLALQAKASALALEILTPLLFVVLSLKHWRKNARRLITLILIALVSSQLIANINIISSGFADYLFKSVEYAPDGVLTAKPLQTLFIQNLALSWQWLGTYLTWPIFILSLVSFPLLIRNNFKAALIFLTIILATVSVFSYLGVVFFPRYFLFLTPLFLVPLVLVVKKVIDRSRYLAMLALALILYLPLQFDYALVQEPNAAPFPEVDQVQYITGTPSGYGLDSVFAALEKLTSAGETILYIESEYYGNLYSATALHFYARPNLKIIRVWPPGILSAPLSPSYLLTQEQSIAPYAIVTIGQRPGGRNPIHLFKLGD